MDRFVKEVDSQKWRGNHHSQDYFVMTIADMDLPLFPAFREAILNKLSLANNFTYKYPSLQYYNSILQWYQLRHIRHSKVNLNKEHIVESPSVLSIIYMMMQNCTQKGDGILLLTPIFTYYSLITEQLERKVVECRLFNQRNGNQSRYDINYTDLEEKAKKAKMMIFCNPHNPTGRIWNQKQVEKVLQICQRNNILLLSDEILSDLVPERLLKRFYSLANSQYPQLVVANSISKAFNAESLKGGYAFIKNEKLRYQYNTSIDRFGLRTNEFAIGCAQIFYSQEGEKWLNHVNEIIKDNYSYLKEKVKNSLLVISQLEAAYIIVISFQGYLKFIERWFQSQKVKKGDSKRMIDLFLQNNRIQGNLLPYASHSIDILTEVRFTIAVESSYFKRFVNRLIASLYEVEYEYRQIQASL